MSRPASLVVFTLGSRADAQRHRLLSPSASGLELGFRRACIESAFEAGRAAGLQLAVCSPEPLPEAPSDARWLRQEEGTFGERFGAAVAQSVGENAEPLVIVGSDVPGLDAALFRATLDGLARDPEAVVVGPAKDGGFYLLATARPLGSVWREVRWCGRDTRRTLLAALQRAGRPVVLLPPLRDLDRPADIEAWLAEQRSCPAAVRIWSDRLRALLSARRRPLVARDSKLALALAFGFLRGRAPPFPAAS